jgi:hypothetical protein
MGIFNRTKVPSGPSPPARIPAAGRISRVNIGGSTETGPSMSREALGGRGPYINPLVRDRITDAQIARFREKACDLDPYLNRLTFGWAEEVLSEVPRFVIPDVTADPLTPTLAQSPEVFPEVRQIIDRYNLLPSAVKAFALTRIHGWSVTILRQDALSGFPTTWVFSAADLLQVHRMPDGTIRSWDFMIPSPPAGYAADGELAGQVVTVDRLAPQGRQPAMDDYESPIGPAPSGTPHIFLERGQSIWGFGESAIRAAWDPAVKLMLLSHAHMLRNRLFTKIILSRDMAETERQAIEDWVDSLDERSYMFLWAGDTINAAGETVPEAELPKVEMTGLVAPGTAEMGTVAISEEQQRICVATGFSLRYFTGDPGGALAAASVDMDRDTRRSIDEFNMLKRWWQEMLQHIGYDGFSAQPICSLQYNYDQREYRQFMAAAMQPPDGSGGGGKA